MGNHPIRDHFGYTGSDEDGAMRAFADRWREALVADGWQSEPLHTGPADDSARYCRDGFVVHVYTQPVPRGWRVSLTAWGPDRLALHLPDEYDFAAITRALRRCDFCDAEEVDTERVAFANRSCKSCLAAARHKMEFRGWNS